MHGFSISIPVPPSVNHMHKSGRGYRYSTAEYRNWQRSAGWEVLRQKPVPLTACRYEVELTLPAKLRGDIDNRIKPVLDLLVKLGVVPDDRFCASVRASADKALVNLASVSVRSVPDGKNPPF